MQIYSIVNVENLRLYEPPMIFYQEENAQIQYIEYFSLEYLNELQEDSIHNRSIRTSCGGNMEYLRGGLKGIIPSKVRWTYIRKLREFYPH